MHVLLFSLFWWQINLGKHHYPQGVQYIFAHEVKELGGTGKQAKCSLKAIEDKWTFSEAIEQYVYYLKHGRLTDEGWKVYGRGCLFAGTVERMSKDGIGETVCPRCGEKQLRLVVYGKIQEINS